MLQIDNTAEIDRIYAQLSQRADLVYSFVTVYNSYINELRDYGTGMLINMVEVHTLTMIADHPGITVSELSVHLYVTGEGERLSTAHKMYDNMDIMQTQRDLLQSCSLEEVDSFYKVLKAYLQLF